MDQDDTKRVIVWSATSILSILMAGNIFFVKKLVDQLDETTKIVWQLRQDVVVLKTVYEVNKMTFSKCHRVKGE